VIKINVPNPERKFNVVVYGIAKSPPNTNKETRIKKDLKNLLTLFSDIDSSIEPKFFCLGKFKPDSDQPRPLLVKFLRSTDTTNVLQNKTKLPSGVYIKPDLSPRGESQRISIVEGKTVIDTKRN